jgi:hypothetical protein
MRKAKFSDDAGDAPQRYGTAKRKAASRGG